MNRRALTTIALALLAVLFATALPRIGFAQSDPLLGMWQLNLAKSKYSPGPSPKSGTIYVRGEGQNRKATAVGIDAAGNPTAMAIARLPQTVFAQSDPLLGTWQLNLAKSKYSGPAPKSGTVYFQAEGQNRKGTAVGIDAAGNPTVLVARNTFPMANPIR